MRSDQEILKLLQQNTPKGMDALFERYYKPLVVFADAYVHDLQGAEDLVQEQMVKLWKGEALREVVPEALSTFLFTVVKNACINWMEKKKLPLTALESTHFQIAIEEAQRMDQTLVKLVTDALQELPAKTRQVVDLVMLQEHTYKEAAETLSVSVNTVKTLLKQGMKVLREKLRDKQYLLLLYVGNPRKKLPGKEGKLLEEILKEEFRRGN